MPEPHLRAADTDRAAVAALLGEHMAAGRLDVAEYDERLTRAYAARTFGELAELTADLPAGSAAAPARRKAEPATTPWAGGANRRAAWASWLTTALIVLAIWGATSISADEWLYPWPIWVIGPWGAVLLAQTLTRGGGEGSGGATAQ